MASVRQLLPWLSIMDLLITLSAVASSRMFAKHHKHHSGLEKLQRQLVAETSQGTFLCTLSALMKESMSSDTGFAI